MHPTDFSAAVESAKLQALYQFAYGLSHEINNPLANIATRAQTLLVDERDQERRRKLATIVQQAFRAHEMIADLMLFARPPVLRPESVDLAQLADTVVSEMQEQARQQGTSLVRTGENGPLVAIVDPTHLAVALKALVQNSLEAVRTEGSIEVSIASAEHTAQSADSDAVAQDSRISNQAVDAGAGKGDFQAGRDPSTQYSVLSTCQGSTPANMEPSLHSFHPPRSPVPRPLSPSFCPPHSALRTPHFLLAVTDTGPGIPPEIRPHIFDPFFSGREAGRGLGLGLSKAWRIVELHGGCIEVESEPGRGAKFTIALPAVVPGDGLAGHLS